MFLQVRSINTDLSGSPLPPWYCWWLMLVECWLGRDWWTLSASATRPTSVTAEMFNLSIGQLLTSYYNISYNECWEQERHYIYIIYYITHYLFVWSLQIFLKASNNDFPQKMKNMSLEFPDIPDKGRGEVGLFRVQ